MLLSVFILAALVAATATFPTRVLRRRKAMLPWDYLYPFSGLLTWLAAVALNIGARASLSNAVVEPTLVAALSATLPWVRMPLAQLESPHARTVSFVLTFIPLFAAVAIRSLVPTLPE